jgi:outer membrane protein
MTRRGVQVVIQLGWLPFIVVSVHAHAQAETDPQAISLNEAVSLAQRNAISVVQAEGQERTSAAAVRSAYGAFIPSLSLSYGATRRLTTDERTRIENGQVVTLADDPWSYSAGLGANLELFDGGRRFFELRQARAGETAAEVNAVAQKYAAALDAKQQYYNVLAARESEVAAGAQLEQAEQQARTSVARARARVATRSDSLRAEIQVRNAQLAVADARNAIEVANASLTRIVGTPYPVTAATDSLERTEMVLGEEELAALAENGPAVREAKALLDATRAAGKASWTEYLPSANLSYSRSGSGASQEFAPASDLSYTGSARLSLSFPVFNQFQREQQITQAQVAEENAEAALRDTQAMARESLIQWLGAFRVAEGRMAAAAATIEAAEEDLRVQQQRYAVGGSTLLDVLTSQTQLDQARRDLIRARYDQRVAKAQLEALVGQDL